MNFCSQSHGLTLYTLQCNINNNNNNNNNNIQEEQN